MNVVLQLPVDKQWELIYTEIQNIIKNSTRNEIETMLAPKPKPESNGYSQIANGSFKTQIWFKGKKRYIVGVFEDEWKAAVAYKLAYHKKNSHQDHNNCNLRLYNQNRSAISSKVYDPKKINTNEE